MSLLAWFRGIGGDKVDSQDDAATLAMQQQQQQQQQDEEEGEVLTQSGQKENNNLDESLTTKSNKRSRNPYPEDAGDNKRIRKTTRLQSRYRESALTNDQDDQQLGLDVILKEILKQQSSVMVEKSFKEKDANNENSLNYGAWNCDDATIECLKKFNSQTLETTAGDVNYVKSVILKKITRDLVPDVSSRIPFIKPVVGLYDPSQKVNQLPNSLLAKYNQVYAFLEHSVINGASSSCLLIGAKKSGKKLTLENALTSLNDKYNSGSNKTFMTIRLNGSLQTDDKSAVREIARQLDVNLRNLGKSTGQFLEFYKEDDGPGYDEYDDDDASDGEQENNDKRFEKRSINETFSAILSSLEQISVGDKQGKAVALVFVIDEFEKFATHNRQTLLYNLFDLASSNHTIPISVVGLTTKVNVKEQLEKRVSSRFSQRIINFFGHFGPKDIGDRNVLMNFHTDSEAEFFWFDLRYNLCLSFEEINNLKLVNKKYGLVWNDYMNALFYHQNFGKNFKELVLKNFITVKNHGELLKSCVYPITKINNGVAAFPLDLGFAKYNLVNNFQEFDASNNILKGLFNESMSDLQLFMVICAARVTLKLDLNFVNFNLCYEEYVKLSKAINDLRKTKVLDGTGKSIANAGPIGFRIWSKKACRATWEKLEELGLIIAPSGQVRLNNRRGKGANNSNAVDNYDTRAFQLEVDMRDLQGLVAKDNMLRRYARV